MQQVEERGGYVVAERLAVRDTTLASRFRVLSVVAGGWTVLMHVLATRSGIGLQEDSAIHIGAARKLVAGHGLTVPFETAEPVLLTQFPPLYAVVLAAHKLTGLPMLGFARWSNAIFAVATVLLVIRLSRSITERSSASRPWPRCSSCRRPG